MKIKNMLFIVIVFAGLFILLTACQSDVKGDMAEVVVEETAVYTPTPEPTATNTPSPTPIIEPTAALPKPTATATPSIVDLRPENVAQDAITYSSIFFSALTDGAYPPILFQHPRSWETYYLTDSGFYTILLSNTNIDFGDDLNKITLLMMLSYKTSPEDFPIPDLPAGMEPVQLEIEDGIALYILADGEIDGYIIKDDISFRLYGDYPLGKESELQEGLELILSTLSTDESIEKSTDNELYDQRIWGTRIEGELQSGDSAVGYASVFSTSEWTFAGTENQEFGLSIDAYGSDTMLALNILDEDGISLLPSGDNTFAFFGSTILNSVEIPEDGIYRIQVNMEGQPYYSWYDISVTEPTTRNEIANVDWLVTPDELNTFTEEDGIIGWEVDIEFADEFQTYRTYQSTSSTSFSNNVVNYIFLLDLVDADRTLEEVSESIYEQELLASTAVTLEPSLQYGENDVMFLASWQAMGTLGNLQYDLFLAGDDVIYWAYITKVTAAEYISEQIFEEFRETAEGILYEIVMRNVERSGQ